MAENEHNSWYAQPRDAGKDAPLAGPGADTASQALADALRLSFRLLTVIMVLVVIAFLLTGIRRVRTDQVGIRSRFGRIFGVSEPGLTYTWPFPVGKMDIVDLSTRELAINDFWMYLSPADMTRDLSEIRTREKGLKPGRDGALMTGDGNMMHAKIMCRYGVRKDFDPQLNVDQVVLFKANVDDQVLEQARKQGVPLHSEDIIRTVVCRAAIHTAATQTAEGLRTDTAGFTEAVAQFAQQQLNELHTGMEIRAVNVVQISWPLRVLPDVAQVSAAQQEVARERNAAEATARSRLSRTAGENYTELVGQIDGSGELGLIQQYELARQQGREKDAGELLEQIDKMLVSGTTGRAQSIIQQAYSDRSAMVEPIKGRLAKFQELLPQYRQDPKLTIARLWAETRDVILSTAIAEKFYVPRSDNPVVVKINRDPNIVRALQQQSLRAGEDKENKENEP